MTEIVCIGHQSNHLQLNSAIVLLIFIQGVISISNHPIIQSHPSAAEVELPQDDRSSAWSEIWICQYRCTDQAIFELLKGTVLLLLPAEWHIFPAQLIKGLSNNENARDESSIIGGKTKEGLKLFNI